MPTVSTEKRCNGFYLHTYTVSGRGPVPMDMLRYDGAYPATSGDAARVVDLSNEPRTVRLVHAAPVKSWRPEVARWSSFGWEVL